MPPLSATEIQSRLASLPDWKLKSGELSCESLFSKTSAHLWPL